VCWYRSENVKTGSHTPSTLARRALRHEFDTSSPTIAPDRQDPSQHLVAPNTAKPSVQEAGFDSVHRKKRLSTSFRSADRKRRSKPSALARDWPSSGSCDNGPTGIRTRRMSVAEACNNEKSVDLTTSGNAVGDSCSQQSYASTVAPTTNLSTEVTGLCYFFDQCYKVDFLPCHISTLPSVLDAVGWAAGGASGL